MAGMDGRPGIAPGRPGMRGDSDGIGGRPGAPAPGRGGSDGAPAPGRGGAPKGGLAPAPGSGGGAGGRPDAGGSGGGTGGFGGILSSGAMLSLLKLSYPVRSPAPSSHRPTAAARGRGSRTERP